MLCLNLSTNVTLEGDNTSVVLSAAAQTVADIVRQTPIRQPVAYGEIISIGGLNPDVNKKLRAGIAKYTIRG